MAVARYFFFEEVRLRVSDGLFGWLSLLLMPLLQLGIFFIVFVEIFHARAGGGSRHDYLAFLALGLWPWLAFSETVLRLSNLLVEKAALAKKVSFSRRDALVGVSLATFAFSFIGFIAVAIFLWAFDVIEIGIASLWFVVPWMVLYILSLAFGSLLAVVAVFIRDIPRLSALGMGLLFFLTPVFYPIATLPASIQSAMAWNPVAVLLDWNRAAFDGHSIALESTVFPLGFVVFVALISVLMYRRYDRHIEDFI